MDLDFRMHAERTPNPNSIKWVLGRPVVEGARSAHFDAAPEPDVSPLAAKLFAVDGVTALELGQEVESREVVRAFRTGGSENGRDDVDGGAELGAVRRREAAGVDHADDRDFFGSVVDRHRHFVSGFVGDATV